MEHDDYELVITVTCFADGRVEVEGEDFCSLPASDEELWRYLPRAVGALGTLQNEVWKRRRAAG